MILAGLNIGEGYFSNPQFYIEHDSSNSTSSIFEEIPKEVETINVPSLFIPIHQEVYRMNFLDSEKIRIDIPMDLLLCVDEEDSGELIEWFHEEEQYGMMHIQRKSFEKVLLLGTAYPEERYVIKRLNGEVQLTRFLVVDSLLEDRKTTKMEEILSAKEGDEVAVVNYIHPKGEYNLFEKGIVLEDTYENGYTAVKLDGRGNYLARYMVKPQKGSI